MAQISTRKAAMTVCIRCQKQWGGLKTAHCTVCCETFSVSSAADKHRTGSHANDTRHCLPPETVGLVDAGRAYPCWSFPSTGDDRWDTDE